MATLLVNAVDSGFVEAQVHLLYIVFVTGVSSIHKNLHKTSNFLSSFIMHKVHQKKDKVCGSKQGKVFI